MTTKRKVAIGVLILVVIIMVCISFTGCGNMDMIDTVRTFDYAYISLPNGECVEGEIESWRDYEDGDQLQIKINGVTYLTDTTRAVLLKR